MSEAAPAPSVRTPIEGAALARLLPHRGAMCVLDAVVSANESTIVCRASSHRSVTNPLRVGGRLQALAAIEYAAQAMAAHGGLATGVPGAAAEPGRLVAVRDVRLHVGVIDDVDEDLEVLATRLAADAAGLVYEFSVSASARRLVEGRAVVMLGRA